MGIELSTLAIIGTVVSVAAATTGGIIAYQGQQQQAENASRIANYNAIMQQRNSDMQSRLAVRQQQINASFLKTQQNQTAGLDNQATAIEQQAAEENRRNNERKQRLLATQRAGYAKAGVVMEGTPLAILADTAGLFELQNQDTLFEANSKAASLRREAELRRAGLAADASVLNLNEFAAKASGRIGKTEAQITRMQGAAAAQGYRNASYGSLLSAAGSVGSAIA
jgi:hypothetical protein